MKLVVGLGNPGREYENTRHNVGWWVVDHLADVWRFPPWRVLSDARAADASVDGRRVRLLEPLTFMNRSGHALAPYAHRPFWAAANDLLVVVDDVALPLGSWRFRAKGSSGGHNGLGSIEETLGTREYARLRIGVGRDEPVPQEMLREFVLGEFGAGDSATVRALLPALEVAAREWVVLGKPSGKVVPPPGDDGEKKL